VPRRDHLTHNLVSRQFTPAFLPIAGSLPVKRLTANELGPRISTPAALSEVLDFMPSSSKYGTLRQPSVVRFGTYEVSLRLGEVRKAGARIRVRPQPMKLLGILLERPQ
jgi:hypothetical protein